MFLHPIGMSTPQPKPKFEYRDRAPVYPGPVDIEAMAPAGHPARAVWDLLESLNFSRCLDQILSREGPGGCFTQPRPPQAGGSTQISEFDCRKSLYFFSPRL